jgi:hypothetical protein
MKVSDVQNTLTALEEAGYGVSVKHELSCGDAEATYSFGREVWIGETYLGLDWGAIKVLTPIAGIISKRASVRTYWSPYWSDDTRSGLRGVLQTRESHTTKPRTFED